MFKRICAVAMVLLIFTILLTSCGRQSSIVGEWRSIGFYNADGVFISSRITGDSGFYAFNADGTGQIKYGRIVQNSRWTARSGMLTIREYHGSYMDRRFGERMRYIYHYSEGRLYLNLHPNTVAPWISEGVTGVFERVR